MDQNLFSCVTTLLRPGRRPKLVRMFRKSPGTTKAESHWTQKALTKKEAPVQKKKWHLQARLKFAVAHTGCRMAP